MYGNGKMRPVEITPGKEGGRIKKMVEDVNSALIHCKNFCKCPNVLPVQQ
jgi:hypothetical protein